VKYTGGIRIHNASSRRCTIKVVHTCDDIYEDFEILDLPVGEDSKKYAKWTVNGQTGCSDLWSVLVFHERQLDRAVEEVKFDFNEADKNQDVEFMVRDEKLFMRMPTYTGWWDVSFKKIHPFT
jgi:hypothetical protein